jgi:hypothetical protein
MPNAQLTYYLFEGILVGTVGQSRFHIPALSGGGGGSTKSAPADSTNNPYMTGLKTSDTKRAGHRHGGAIPVGKYTISAPVHNPHLGLAAQLTPSGRQPMYGRGGFYIHGHGPHGSDGCIVPLQVGQFKDLMRALATSNGGQLHVEDSMEGAQFA